MRISSLAARFIPALPTLIVVCALSACGGGSDSGSGFFSGLPGAGTPTPPVTPVTPDTPVTPTPPDTGVAPVKRCAP